MTRQIKKSFTAAIAVALLVGAYAYADTSSTDSSSPSTTSSSTAPKHHHHHMRKAFKACAAADGITLPAKGSGQTLSSSDKSEIHSCMQEFHQNMSSCLQDAGVEKPAQGQKPSAAQKAAFKQCETQSIAKIAS